MNIFDLNYLEVVTEAASITGGKKRRKAARAAEVDLKLDPKVNVDPKLELNALKAQVNVATGVQVAVPVALAVSVGGSAVASASATLNSNIEQNNQG